MLSLATALLFEGLGVVGARALSTESAQRCPHCRQRAAAHPCAPCGAQMPTLAVQRSARAVRASAAATRDDVAAVTADVAVGR